MAAKLSQEQLGDKLNVSGQAIGHWERGRSLPQATELPEVARALGVNLLELYELSEQPKTDIEICAPTGERYLIEVKGGQCAGKTEQFLTQTTW